MEEGLHLPARLGERDHGHGPEQGGRPAALLRPQRQACTAINANCCETICCSWRTPACGRMKPGNWHERDLRDEKDAENKPALVVDVTSTTKTGERAVSAGLSRRPILTD